ncbi:hypothetical protein T10_5159 [Trichinella papuae]|uniref:Uncharacterized protein n=1 Tax=Trichinella papuae TaxID=268474 RepID=A0A0V1MGN4_9BILA|nr:hypothetical protein T10_1763 [Trichinella papuae]KRZ70967.1 hypothetical protein T10_5159 [Trichinella papuae]
MVFRSARNTSGDSSEPSKLSRNELIVGHKDVSREDGQQCFVHLVHDITFLGGELQVHGEGPDRQPQRDNTGHIVDFTGLAHQFQLVSISASHG